jgi:hypothetical protein
MSKTETTVARRKLFAGAGAVGALAGAAAVLPLAQRAQAPADAAAKPAPEAGGGYQVTQHVLRYYETTRV